MSWILRAREPETAFLAQTPENVLKLIADPRQAKVFDSSELAEQFAVKIEARDLCGAWASRPPELVPVRIDARSFIVSIWSFLLDWLGKISLFWLIRELEQLFSSKVKYRSIAGTYVFVELWALFWNAVALISIWCITRNSVPPNFLVSLIVFFGALRVAELIVYQTNVTFFDEYRHKEKRKGPPYAVRSFRRLVVLTGHNYLEILLWFSVFYVFFSREFHPSTSGLALDSLSGSVYFSVLTMTTLGYGDIYPSSGSYIGALLTITQTLIGVFLAVIVFARVVALIPRPLSMDEYEGV